MTEATNLVSRTDQATATISGSLVSLQQRLGIGTKNDRLSRPLPSGRGQNPARDQPPFWQINLGPSPGPFHVGFGALSIILVLSVFIVSDASGLQAEWRR